MVIPRQDVCVLDPVAEVKREPVQSKMSVATA